MDFDLYTLEYDDEGIPTKTSEMQKEKCNYIKCLRSRTVDWNLGDHIGFLSNLINKSSVKGQRSESIIPVYAAYSLAAFPILGIDQSEKFPMVRSKMEQFLSHRMTESGQFSGFSEDNCNIITNLQAITALSICGDENAYKLIDRSKMYNFLMSLKQNDGSFSASLDSEIDLRSTYAALAIANILNIMTPELTKDVLKFTKSCFNYDGGFSPTPFCESHGGFVHCGVGILYILNALDEIDLNLVVRYIAMRQDEFAGGFNGRTNKLVDSCYSWWMGTAARIISNHLKIPEFWNVDAMSQYILRSSQIHSGGFCDSPPNDPDPLHTCYSMAGLCVVGSGERVKVVLPVLDLTIPAPKESVDRMKKYFSDQGVFVYK
ncbi:Prenyltransferase and squalene oxidase repeat family protein [Trichomonas vaginalis G3]|uniref:Prenyltransferase and squalene oxidase repeat family protein n=1 Tax=Trichomonas vaginalis (strain ATCC PRA-98 / G3) TaxID=412133 RepID=A2DHE3_TRIV3|nr:protein farnesylation [Trichomonas vaginalis G3]EAY20216.1 Prenyltransferase and squalene oxidase repeat family protein [Trichomonas vaginalis G3]KAI5507711.1 protein farnesylation [Trichomonas vaginalis G3]|eukprot:XP_001581202.1 Prenyltransferase and squalene oxidase repeat family protein [Trichomonas vaginalis G3]